MAQTHETTDEQYDVAEILQALIADGRQMADLAADFLCHWFELYESNPASRFPAEFVLEVSAILRIASWQRSGLVKELTTEFPPADALLDQLLGRLADDPFSFSYDPNHCPAPLSREILRVWFERCSWKAPGLLGADITVDPQHLELQLDVLAELLWTCRHLKQRRSSHAGAIEEPRSDFPAPQ